MRVGVHVPVGWGLRRAARHARSLGCECLQIFARNPRGWRSRVVAEEEAAEFRDVLTRFDISPLVVHASYLVNLAGPDRALRERSLRSVLDDMGRAAALGGQAVVVHPGHYMHETPAAGLRTLAASIRRLIRDGPESVDILLENTAGRGSEIGAGWEEFSEVLDRLGGEARVGVCFDTCHAHAAGHRLDGPRPVGRALREFAAALGMGRLRLIHLNDSRGPAGSRRDLHEHIGLGTIGDRGLGAFVRRRELRDRCAILETPINRPGDDRRNLNRVRGLMRSQPRVKPT